MATRTAASVIKYLASTDHLTNPRREGIEEQLNGRTIDEVLAMDALELADVLYGLPDVDNSELPLIAQDILAGIRKYVNKPTASGSANTATTVNVTMPTPRNEMSLARLFEELLNDLTDTGIIEFITGNNTVREAEATLQRNGKPTGLWVIVVEGQIDLPRTLKYLSQLANGAVPQRKVDGIRPVTFHSFLGQERNYIFNPLFTNEGEILLASPYLDGEGYDWSDERTVPIRLYVVVVRERTQGRLVNANESELLRLREDIFSGRTPRWLTNMVDDLEETPRASSRYLSEQEVAKIHTAFGMASPDVRGRLPFESSSEPARDETWYEAQLRANTRRDVIVGSGSEDVRPGIYERITVRSGSAHLRRGVIVLNLLHVNSGGMYGSAFVHRRLTNISRNSGEMNVDTTERTTWEQLYKDAVELGLIVPASR